MAVFSQSTDNIKLVNAESIEDIKLHMGENVGNYELYLERLYKFNPKTESYDSQVWKKDKSTNNIILDKQLNHKSKKSFYAGCSQTWYQNNMENKIEIEIFVCQSDSVLNRLVTRYTREQFSMPFIATETAVVGEKNWIPKYEIPNSSSSVLMFQLSNVFVRVYARLKNVNKSEIEDEIITICKNIENKIKAN